MQRGESWPRGCKTFFILNSAMHVIFSANKYENANNSWHFHIYQQRNFHAQLCLARKKMQLLVIWDLIAWKTSCSTHSWVEHEKRLKTSEPGLAFDFMYMWSDSTDKAIFFYFFFKLIFFLFLHKNICSGYSSKAPQHMFTWKIKKNVYCFLSRALIYVCVNIKLFKYLLLPYVTYIFFFLFYLGYMSLQQS